MGVLKEKLESAADILGSTRTAANADCGMADSCGEDVCLGCELLDGNHCARCCSHEGGPR